MSNKRLFYQQWSTRIVLLAIVMALFAAPGSALADWDYRLDSIPTWDTCLTPTYDNTGQATHPGVVYFPDGFYNGMDTNYFYMAMTPYAYDNGNIENPSIIASQNGYTFYEEDSLRNIYGTLGNPLVNQPTGSNAHNDDADLFWNDATDEFLLYYLETHKYDSPRHQDLVLLRSDDGLDWDTSTSITWDLQASPADIFIVSPSLVRKDTLNYLFYVNTSASPDEVEYLVTTDSTAFDSTTWDKDSTNDISIDWPDDFVPWHLSVFDGGDGRFYMLCNGHDPSGFYVDHVLYLATSKNLTDWDVIPTPLLDSSAAVFAGDVSAVYRSTGHINYDMDKLVVWFSWRSQPAPTRGNWHTGVQTFALSDWITTDTLMVPGQYATIQAAIDAAAYGDTVLVSPGTYYENIDFAGKPIVVMSTHGADTTAIWADTIGLPTVAIEDIYRRAELNGFTVSGSRATGIFCDNASPVIVNNIVEYNHSNTSNDGGGLDLNNTNGSYVANNIFRYDSASTYGAAIHTQYCVDDTICYNLIHDCWGWMDMRLLSTTGLVHNNTIYAGRWHGISNQSGQDTVDIKNNIVIGSPAYGVYAANDGYARVSNNINYDCNYGAYAGAGIINAVPGNSSTSDPLLTPDYRPYRLSPAIDAGDAASYFDDPDGTANDIGMYPVYQVGSTTDYTTIQSAIDDLSDGEVIIVLPDTLTENIDFSGKRLIVTSSTGYDSTVIVAYNADEPTVRFEDEPKGAELSYFTITGSDASGIYCYNSSPRIEGNLVEYNRSDSSNVGAGLDLNYTNEAVVTENVFRRDSAQTYGAAIHTEHCTDDTISYNLFYENWGYMEIRCLSSNTFIYNNTIDASGSRAHGISNQSSYDTIECRNNIIVGAAMDGIYAANNGFAEVAYNLIYDCAGDTLDGAGIIYAGGDVYADPLLDANYLLDSLSPAIDAGDPTAFFNDPDESRNDMGWKPYGSIFVLSRVVPDIFAETELALPGDYSLAQNYPNPFNPSTTISFTLPTTAYVELSIYNVLGQKVKTLVLGEKESGTHTVEWNSSDQNGQQVASGVYLYRIETDDFAASKKMMLLK